MIKFVSNVSFIYNYFKYVCLISICKTWFRICKVKINIIEIIELSEIQSGLFSNLNITIKSIISFKK